MREYGLEEGLILTLDDEEVLEINLEGLYGKEKRKIVIKPVWKWMFEFPENKKMEENYVF